VANGDLTALVGTEVKIRLPFTNSPVLLMMLDGSSKGSRGNRGVPVGMAAKTKYIREFDHFYRRGSHKFC
jgi:hypothetical protein